MDQNRTEQAIPNPEFLIKSIAEQGYSLESALADLIDNSISAEADKIEVLTDQVNGSLNLFLTDNGAGMSEKELRANMQFPSDLMENTRAPHDLGRFGLGMKTASFSQTRYFTVVSRKKGTSQYFGRTWDVELLKKGKWEIVINTSKECEALLNIYRELQSLMIGKIPDYEPNTIVFWRGLYKYDNILDRDKKQQALNKQLNEITREYLGIIFHRFLQRELRPVEIKLNNLFVDPFDPFPSGVGLRSLGFEQIPLKEDILSMEGFVLPSEAIRSKDQGFRTEHRGMMDLEGMYVYRSDRIILFGGWNGVIRKRANIQLARLRIDVGNASDSLLQLNVAKSNVVIPYDLKSGFLRYVVKLTEEARREYFSHEITNKNQKTGKTMELFSRVAGSKGNRITINREYPLVKEILQGLSKDKASLLNTLLYSIQTRINKLRQVHEDSEFVSLVESKELSQKDLTEAIKKLVSLGMNPDDVLNIIAKDMGIKLESLPEEIKNLTQKSPK